MNKLKKVLASVLSLLLIVSMVPGSALAADVQGALPSADYITAEFTTSPQQGADGKLPANTRVWLEVTPSDSMTALKAYRMVIDWQSLKDYTTQVTVKVDPDDSNAVSEGGTLTKYNGPGTVNTGSSSYGDYPEGSTYAAYASSSGSVNPNGGVILAGRFTLDPEIPAGTYTVPIHIFELNENNVFTIDPFQSAQWATVEAVLTILDNTGNVPEPPVEPTTYTISKEFYPAGTSNGTIELDKTSAEENEEVGVTVTPAANYQIKEVKTIVGTAETVLNGTDVVNGAGDPTGAKTYSFQAPAANVTVRAEFELIPGNDVTDTLYPITISNNIEHGVIACELHEANEGTIVQFTLTPDSDYEPDSVRVISSTNQDVSVSQVGEADTLTGAYTYQYTMPNSAVTLTAQMKLKNGSGNQNQDDPSVPAGFLNISGTVVTSNGRPLAGAEVRLVYVDGANPGTLAGTAIVQDDGSYVFDPNVSNAYKYTVEAFYDTRMNQGQQVASGQIVSSGTKEVSKSSNNTDNHGEAIVAALTVTLCYDWDVDNDGEVERIYAGPDDQFITTDDFYKKDIKDNQDNVVRNVDVFADANGAIQSETAYFMWEVDDDGVKEPVYVGTGFRAGTPQNYYYSDVDHGAVDAQGQPTADVKVYVGPDQVPATSDDNYVMDVNGDGNPDTVMAGNDGLIATADDWYDVGGTTIYAGADEVAGTADDWYGEDTDQNGILDGPNNSANEQVFVGTDRLPHTNDDNYIEDVNGDGEDETVYAGPFPAAGYAGGDATFNTDDDWYAAIVDSTEVKVYPGATGDANDPYEFGRDNDHYDWSVDNVAVAVRVGEDKLAGTADDNYDFEINGVIVVVFAGENGVPGDFDDYYFINAYGADEELEQVFCGEDNELGTEDDYYEKNVNSDEAAEKVFAGEDKQFNTADDFYNHPVGTTIVIVISNNTVIGDAGDSYQWTIGGNDTQVFVGTDGVAGGEADDDYYVATVTDADDQVTEVQVFTGEDHIPGTADDHYSLDADDDADEEECFNGEDGTPGTADDFYEEDVNNDGEDETVYAGEDTAFDTADDYYEDTVAGEDVDVFAGEDEHIGSEDDTYEWTVPTADGEQDVDARVGDDLQAGTEDDEYDATVPTADGDDADVVILAGDDKELGTDDDHYAFDADGDGEDEDVNVGEDAIPGSADDNYTEDVNGDDEDETVFAGEDETFDTSDDHYFDDINGEPIDVFAGEDTDIGTADDTYEYTDGNDIDHDMFVGEDRDPGTADDYYLEDVDGDGEPEEILNGSGVPGDSGDHYFMNADDDAEDEDCHVGNDGIPGTADDYYVEDVNGDGADETVFAGEDEEFGTCDDYYQALVRDPEDEEGNIVAPIYAGADEHFSEADDPNNDDWFPGDTNGDGVVDPSIYDASDNHDKIFVDGDTFADNADDYYIADVDGDGEDEIVNVGEDGKPLTNDDNYTKDVNGDGEDETVYAGPEDGDGHFGSPDNPSKDDYYNYDYTIEPDVTVRSGEDGLIGTADDEYDYDINGDGVENDPTMFVGADEQPGTEDDYYLADPDNDGEPEPVYAGEDGYPGTDDDWFPIDDIDGDGQDETGHVGDDGLPGTGDEFYDADPDKDGEDEPIDFGADDKPGTSDDTYPVDDVDGDGEDELGHVGDDGIPGTDDDYYDYDADNDGEEEPVDYGEDGKPGTEDDTYPVDDIDGDGEDETGHVGDDGIPATDDDYYDADPDGDGEEEPVDYGEDGKPGTPDDTYPVDDVDGDDVDETGHVGDDGIPGTEDDWYECSDPDSPKPIHAGDDGKPGTPDDWYEEDVDNDGEDEVVYVGDDCKPHTDDDWYYADITFDGNGGQVNGAATYKVIQSALNQLPTASRSSYTFNGWTLEKNTGKALTLDEIKALKADTTVYASWTYAGGGGGFSGGGSSTTYYTVEFESNGGSAVPSQSVESGKTATEPKTPEKTDYNFIGWFADKDLKEAYDFNSKVTKNITLYAKWEKKTVQEIVFGLLTSKHVDYVDGYNDGTVHPEGNLTRAEAAVLFFRLLNDDARAKYATKFESFDDVPADAWYTEAVATLQRAGIIEGYGNGKFGPNDLITRAQFAAICARIGKLEYSGTMSFDDVAVTHWAHDEIGAAAENGWVNGYGNGKFGPDDYVTRAQAIVLMNRVLARDGITEESIKAMMSDPDFQNFSDNQNSASWFYLDIIEAANGHDYTIDDKGVETWTELLP